MEVSISILIVFAEINSFSECFIWIIGAVNIRTMRLELSNRNALRMGKRPWLHGAFKGYQIDGCVSKLYLQL